MLLKAEDGTVTRVTVAADETAAEVEHGEAPVQVGNGYITGLGFKTGCGFFGSFFFVG